MLTGELIDHADAVAPHAAAWDALAAENRLPYCTPAWMLGWWTHARPAGGRLRVAVALDGGALAGVAPCYAVRERGVEHLRMLASPTAHRAQPVSVRGREREVVGVLAGALAAARPRAGVLAFAGVPEGSPWPALLAAGWPGSLRAGRRLVERVPAPLLSLSGKTYEEWFASRSKNFRSQMRRAQRSLEEQGARVRMAATPAEIDQDVRAFIRLHHARWDPRGGSEAIDEGVERMLRATATELVGTGNLRLAAVVAGEQTVAVQAMVAAGGEVSYWLGGFDEAWSRSKPALVALLAAVEDAFERQDDRLDLGAGVQEYKLRFADGQEVLEWSSVVPRGVRAPLDWALLAPSRARSALGRATYERRASLRRRLRKGT